MNKEQIIQQLINSYSDAYQNLGYSSLMGKIVALLLSEPEPVSLDQISESLSMSKGPVSQICRKLKEHRLIEKVWIPGERKDYYKAADDIFGQAFSNYAHSMKRNLAIAEQCMNELEKLSGQDKQTDHLEARMREMANFYRAMDQHNKDFIEEWRKNIKPEIVDVVN